MTFVLSRDDSGGAVQESRGTWFGQWVLDDIEKDDEDIIPDETPPLPPEEPVKTDPIPEEAP